MSELHDYLRVNRLIQMKYKKFAQKDVSYLRKKKCNVCAINLIQVNHTTYSGWKRENNT